jgi:hypothetical protein
LLITAAATTISEENTRKKKAVWGGKDGAPLIPDLSVIVNMPPSDSWSFAIRCGNAARRLKPSELTTAAGGSTNVMRLPELLSDMAKK